jgi:hypothetical protein
MVSTLERLARALQTDLNQLTGFDLIENVEEELAAASA